MAAVYNAEGIFMYDDGQPSIDQMQYELARNGKPSPLDTAVNAIKNVAVNNNPLMLRKQGIDLAGDIPRVAASGMAPFIAGITQPLVGMYNLATIANKMPGVLYRENVLGDPQSMQEAAEIRAGLPQDEQTGPRYNPEPMNRRIEAIGQAVAPQTPQGQAVLEGLSNLLSPLKAPMMGPGSGMPGTSRVSPRPFFTPNDLRVVGAEATRVGKQIGEIPTDFVNAQSGFQRIDPVTNQPVIGARIQGGIDRLGDIMEQRRMQGLSPIPGLPDVLQPQTNMYAVRPSEGPNYVVKPKLPESALEQRPDLDTAGIYSAINDLRPIQNPTINNVNGAYFATNIVDNPTIAQAYTAYYDNVLRTLFPDTQNITDANTAYELTYPRIEERSKVNRTIINNFINEFNQTAEPNAQLPTMEQFAENVKAADKWLDNTFTKQLVKNVGTTNDPLLKLSEQGITFKDPMQLVAEYSVPSAKLQNARQAAGFNPSGEYFDAMNAAKQELDQVTNDEYLPLERQRIQAQEAAARLGIPVTEYDPYRNLTAPRDRAAAKVEKLEEAYKKLQIANAYSNAVDSMVTTKTAKQAWDKIPRTERQFYPQLRDLAANAPDTPIYDVFAKHSASGYQEMGQEIVKQIVKGEIKAKDLHKTPLDVMVKKKAEARDAVEKAAQTEIKQRVNAVSTKLIEDLSLVPEVFRFSNASVLEVSNKYDVDTIRRILSADTDVLDLCAANSGSPPKSAKSIYHPNKADKQGYYPSADPITGKRLRPTVGDTIYVKGTASGAEFNSSIRDNVTGLPVGLLQFTSLGPNRAGVTEYSMGFVSGFKNHEPIEPQYRDVVRDYLNLRADIIKSSNSEKLATNGIYDTSKPTQQLLNNLNLSKKQWDEATKAYAGAIPRFITAEDGRNILQAVRDQQRAVAPVTQTPNEVGDMQTQRIALLEEQTQLQNEQLRGNQDYDVTQRLDDIASQLQDIDQRLARSTQPVEIPQTFQYGNLYEIARGGAGIEPMARLEPEVTSTIASAFQHLFPQHIRRNDGVRRSQILSPEQVAEIIEELETSARQIDDLDEDAVLEDFNITSQDQQDRVVDQLTDAAQRLRDAANIRIGDDGHDVVPQQQQPQGVEQRLSDLRQLIDVPMHRENDPQVEQALGDYAAYLQERINVQTRAGYLPEHTADVIRTDINQLRNDTFNNPNDYTVGFTARQVDDFVGALRTTIDTIGHWLEEQRRQQAPEPDVQEQRLTVNQQITNAYRNEFSLTTEEPDVDDFLIEFQDYIDNEVNRLFGEGRTHNDIAMYVADTISERIRELVEGANNGGATLNMYNLNHEESNIARGRLNTAFMDVLDTVDTDEGLNEPDPTNAPEDYENIYFGPVETRPATTPAQALPPPVQTRAQLNPDANIDSFINRVRREEGAQIADRVETVAYRVAENVTNSMVNQLDEGQAEAFARGLRVAAELEDSELVEIALRELADMVTTLVAQEPEAPLVQPAAPQVPVTRAIQTAFTPNTGSAAADAYLAQYGDTLATQMVEFENAGNDPAEVVRLINNEIQGHFRLLVRLADQPNGEQATGLTNAENMMVRHRLETALGNIRFSTMPPEGNQPQYTFNDLFGANAQPAQPAVPPPVARQPDADVLGPRLNTIREDIVNRDDAAGFIVDEIFGAHAQAGTRQQILSEIVNELEGRIQFIRDMPINELEDYGIDGPRMRNNHTLPALARALHDVRVLQTEMQQAQPNVVDYNSMIDRFNNIQAYSRFNDNLSELVSEVWNDSVDRLAEHEVGIPPQNLRDMIGRMLDDLDERQIFFADLQPDQFEPNGIDGIGDYNELMDGITAVMRQLRQMREEMAPVQLEQQQAFTPQDALDMARELLNQERMDGEGNRVHVPSVQDSINVLRDGNFDDARIRQLPERLRQPFAESVANALETLLHQEAPQTQPRAQEVDQLSVTAQTPLTPDRANGDPQVNAMLADVQAGLAQQIDDLRFEARTPEDIASIISTRLSQHITNAERVHLEMGTLTAAQLHQYVTAIRQAITAIRQFLPEENALPQPDNVFGITGRALAAPQNQALEQRWRNEIFTGDLTERQALTRLNSILNNTNLSVENILALGNVVNDPDSPQFRFADDARMDMYNARINDAIAQRVISNLTARDRELYSALSDVVDNAIEEGAPLPDPTDGEAYAQLILDDEIGGELTELTDVERHRLAAIVRRYGADATLPPEGHKDGGRIRKYQDGGSTSDYGDENNAALDDFERMKLERWMSKRPEFHVPSKEFNDDTPDLERDDDIQVPKESTFDAKLKTPWEDDEWMARNWIRKHYMDMFAKGGTVRTIPSVDQMKYELMMRRK
jgi:hypothetical protein